MKEISLNSKDKFKESKLPNISFVEMTRIITRRQLVRDILGKGKLIEWTGQID